MSVSDHQVQMAWQKGSRLSVYVPLVIVGPLENKYLTAIKYTYHMNW